MNWKAIVPLFTEMGLGVQIVSAIIVLFLFVGIRAGQRIDIFRLTVVDSPGFILNVTGKMTGISVS